MNLLIFQNPYEIFQFFFTFLIIPFLKELEAITVQLLFNYPENSCVRYGIFVQKYIQNS